jgi:hypothetical protein
LEVSALTIVPEDLFAVAATFEDMMQTRTSTQTRITHLHNNRTCTSCNRDFAPKSLDICPTCGSSESIKRGKVRICQGTCKEKGIDTRWEPTANRCPHCLSAESVPHPKNTENLELLLAQVQLSEKLARKQLEQMVTALPVWDWAKDVKGLGAISIGRIMGRTDFSRVRSVSAMWSHFGYGLKNGQPQRKRVGEKIDYDPKAKVSAYLMGQCLMRAKGPYYELYLRFRREADEKHPDWTDAHRHAHAMRLMVKVALAHIYEVVKVAEGADPEDVRPYAFAILKHDPTHYISPWDMVDPKKADVA